MNKSFACVRVALFGISVAAALASGQAQAWGSTGHRAVCEIAYAELDDAARATVERLIRRDPQYRRFADSCTWADGPPRQHEPDHYINFPRDTQAVARGGCPLSDTCILAGIERDVAILADPARNDSERLEALKLLGHWVGDIHQPMHVTFADDLGANLVLAIVEQDGEPVETNLHAVWDSWIIRQRLGDDYRPIAKDLRAALTDAERENWRYDGPLEWANESFQLARQATTQYCVRQQGACWYSADNMILDRGEPRRQLDIDDAYAAEHFSTIERRLLQAGVRLGALLNRILD